MEPNGVVSSRHRRTPSSDRFLDVFSPLKFDTMASGGDELNEDDVLWTGDFTDRSRRSTSTSSPSVHQRQFFRQPEKFGILTALSEDNNRKAYRPVLYRKPTTTISSLSASRMIPAAIPKPPPEREHYHSAPGRKLQQSAPVKVPVLPRKVRKAEVDWDNDDDDDEMLPPHEIVARGSSNSPKTTFSVLEGVGRTLKGRDLRQVRNAVWRQTGFLD